MANDISTVVWRIDTLPFSFVGRVYISSASWSDQAAADDILLFTDNNGKPLFDTKAYAKDFLQNLITPGWVNGVTGVTLASGVLYLTVGGKR